MSLLEDSWEQREEVIYKNLFGDLGECIFPLDEDIFINGFKQESYDPRWLHHGVFSSPPNGDRKTWLYVTSGMSNPWEAEQVEEYSGFGTELVMETKEKSDWAMNVLRKLMAYNILLAHGIYGDCPLLDYWHRIPFALSRTNSEEINICYMMIVTPNHYPQSIELKSGKVDFLHIIGITEKELEYAKKNGSNELYKLLVKEKIAPVTYRDRSCIFST
ncbi:MAG: suppressor of fused domain protein [Spirochaetales bacterium]|nr:suppressor of fused domain protein [Spirochaetales bacterium]